MVDIRMHAAIIFIHCVAIIIIISTVLSVHVKTQWLRWVYDHESVKQDDTAQPAINEYIY